MSAQIDKSTLGYLGEDVQFKIVKEFMEDKSLFKDLEPLVDQNMFTGQYLKMYVGTMLEYYRKYGCIPSYSAMSVELRQKAHTQADIEICDAIVDKVRSTNSYGAENTKVIATRFFRQQRIIKAGKEILRLAGDGDLENYDTCEKLLREALNAGNHDDYEEVSLFDGVENVLSEDFRITIPTGIGLIDKVLNGGLGKGELGLIVGPTSFGKTSLTTSMAADAAVCKSEQNGNLGFKVLQIVFEDTLKQIQRKHFSKITQVEACQLSNPEYVEHVREQLEHYDDRVMLNSNLKIVRLKSGQKTIEDVIKIIEKHINNGFRPDLVIIDYFECLKITGPSTMSKWDKESQTMRKIESAANELNTAFWVATQGNRDSINTDLVTMDKAGGSIGKIQIAHIIMTITRSQEDIADNIATIAITKNRAGSSGRVFDGVYFNNGTCTISTDNVEEFDTTMAFDKEKTRREDDRNQETINECFNRVKNKN